MKFGTSLGTVLTDSTSSWEIFRPSDNNERNGATLGGKKDGKIF